MRAATRQEEATILNNVLNTLSKKDWFLVQMFVAAEEDKYNVVCKRIARWNRIHGSCPPLWQWQEYLVTLQLGWRRYFYRCNHKDSIFVKWYLKELKLTNHCTCCLYWRAIAYSVPIGIISFLLGKHLS